MIYTSGTQNYDSKIGINLYPLPVGKFTIIMEYYFSEDINISLLAEASTAIINKQAITNFPSYKKQLVQINQQTKDTPDYLFFTIRGFREPQQPIQKVISFFMESKNGLTQFLQKFMTMHLKLECLNMIMVI